MLRAGARRAPPAPVHLAKNIDGRRNRLIVGAAYWFPHPGNNANAALMLDWEQVTFENLPGAVQKRLTVHGLIQF